MAARFRPRPLPLLLALVGMLILGLGNTAAFAAADVAPDVPTALPIHQVDSRLSDYPRLIRLAHAGADNGTLLVAAGGATPGLAITRSTDGGVTWSDSGTAHAGSYACCAALIELPTGAILLAGTVSGGSIIEVNRSLDHGRSWSFLSNVVTGGQGGGYGLWEPEFTFDASGRLVCFFSDERHQGEGYSQLIAHVVSTDGGQSWYGETRDIAIADNSSRPGMARVVRVPGGSYMMAYEVCGWPGCAVFTRTSPDADNWGDPTQLGNRVHARDGAYFISAPGLTWVASGAPAGRLVVTAKYLAGTGQPDTGRLLMTTTDLSGTSDWDELPAPAAIAVDGNGGHCANYSSSLLPSADGTTLIEVAGSITGSACRIVVAASTAGALPYSAPFDQGTSVGWNTYGGGWTVTDGALRNSQHSGQGDKALAGSTAWSDVNLSADVRVDSYGVDAGVLVRVNGPTVGVDSLSGYTVGISSTDGRLYLGRFAGGWSKLADIGVPDGVVPGQWYGISVNAVGCTFSFSVTNRQTGQTSSSEYIDGGCQLTSGQIGVRSHNGPASWRNLTVNAAS